jgi:hypothetical protein
LGISVPVPAGSDAVLEAILEGLLLKKKPGQESQLLISGFEEFAKPQTQHFYEEWENVSQMEKRSRTVFAQEGIKPDEIAGELRAVRESIGFGVDVKGFVCEGLKRLGAVISENDSISVDLSEVSQALKDILGISGKIKFRFDLPVAEDEIYLHRTHPIVESLANYIMDTSFDPILESIASRTGVIRTRQVNTRTTLLFIRLRYHIVVVKDQTEHPLLAEDCATLAFEGSADKAIWLDGETAESLLNLTPDANVSPDQAKHFLSLILKDMDKIIPHLESVAEIRGKELLDAHRRVRQTSKIKGVRYRVEPQLPPDVLGVYVFLPVN